jgi:hypothetical protein
MMKSLTMILLIHINQPKVKTSTGTRWTLMVLAVPNQLSAFLPIFGRAKMQMIRTSKSDFD